MIKPDLKRFSLKELKKNAIDSSRNDFGTTTYTYRRRNGAIGSVEVDKVDLGYEEEENIWYTNSDIGEGQGNTVAQAMREFYRDFKSNIDDWNVEGVAIDDSEIDYDNPDPDTEYEFWTAQYLNGNWDEYDDDEEGEEEELGDYWVAEMQTFPDGRFHYEKNVGQYKTAEEAIAAAKKGGYYRVYKRRLNSGKQEIVWEDPKQHIRY